MFLVVKVGWPTGTRTWNETDTTIPKGEMKIEDHNALKLAAGGWRTKEPSSQYCEIICLLSKHFNKSIKLGIVPYNWRIAASSYIKEREGKKSNLGNYRLVSKTLIICKVLPKNLEG